MRGFLSAALIGCLAALPAAAEDATSHRLEIADAWVPKAQARQDVPLYMTLRNPGEEADTLLRARCPVADFMEKHVTDRGEGGYAMREVKTFTVPAGQTMTLAPRGPHLMLLHARQNLEAGEHFTCSVVFQKAGTLSVDVVVAADEGKGGA